MLLSKEDCNPRCILSIYIQSIYSSRAAGHHWIWWYSSQARVASLVDSTIGVSTWRPYYILHAPQRQRDLSRLRLIIVNFINIVLYCKLFRLCMFKVCNYSRLQLNIFNIMHVLLFLSPIKTYCVANARFLYLNCHGPDRALQFSVSLCGLGLACVWAWPKSPKLITSPAPPDLPDTPATHHLIIHHYKTPGQPPIRRQFVTSDT